mgnify:CR=1 FL=1
MVRSGSVYCRIKIPTIAEGNPESCMRIFPIIADAFGISLRPQQMLWVGKMNNLIACAEEIVVREVVYV